jgi:RND superfamily putative drug exporter
MATMKDPPILDAPAPLEPGALRQSGLYRWGVRIARRRRAVLGVSLLLFILGSASLPALQKALGPPGITVKGSASARVEQVIEQRFSRFGSEDDLVVFHSARQLAGDPEYRRTIAAVDRAVRAQKGVRSVIGPYDSSAVGQILAGEHTAVTLLTLAGTPERRFNGSRSIQTAVTHAAGANGVEAMLTGASPVLRDLTEVQTADTKHAEMIGLPLALVILVLALGALVAAMVPLLLAVAGLSLAYGVLVLLTLVLHFDSFLLAIVTMIGLGIGIDYSLFIVSRFREELARSSPGEREESERVADAVGVALATSGRTILFSGVIVALSLASLFVANFDVFREIAVGAVVVVACMLTAAMTLLPAALALLGSRINRGALPARMQPADARRPAEHGARQGGWARWALLVMRRPVLAATAAATVLLVAATPVLHLHYGFNVGVLQDTSTISGKGERLLAQAISPGAVGPVQLVVTGGDHADSARTAAASLSQKLENDPQVTAVAERQGRAGVLIAVIPSVSIDSPAATALVRHIRHDLAPPLEAHGGPTVLVGGPTAQALDASSELDAKLPLIVALILGPSFLFLLIALRSVVLPIKAVLMNLLATAAAMGIVVWIFEDGHGQHLLNFTSPGFIQSTVPLVMFALLFGLSMDYEVFLIRRVQEEWRKTGDNTLAVAAGIEHTGRPITAAAAIMIAVFGCFVITDLLEVKQLGFALALAIALDATVIRLVLVPAVMRLFGARNWWLPAWLARVLPDLGGD